MTAGRQRSFDKESALEKAMLVFWKNGYMGTSLTDLTDAMGINKPSLYAAFGNKEALFNQTIELYLAKYGLVHSAYLVTSGLSLKERIRNYFLSIIAMLTDANLPKGCLICLCTSEAAGSRLPAIPAEYIMKINQQTVSYLTDFFEKEKLVNSFISELGSVVIANYILTLLFGLAVAARNGSNKADLLDVIDLSISMFDPK